MTTGSVETLEGRLARLEGRLGMLQTDFNKHCTEGTQAGTPPGRASVCSDEARNADQSAAKHHQPHFLGPTRPAYAFNIARASLQGTGVPVDDPAFSSPPSPTLSTHELGPPSIVGTSDLSRDPLRTTSKAKVIHLLTVYGEELSPVYPIFDAQALISQTEATFDAWLAARSCVAESSELDIPLVRVAIATAECVESMGANEFSQKLISLVEAEVSKSYASSVLSCRDAVILTALVTSPISLRDKVER